MRRGLPMHCVRRGCEITVPFVAVVGGVVVLAVVGGVVVLVVGAVVVGPPVSILGDLTLPEFVYWVFLLREGVGQATVRGRGGPLMRRTGCRCALRLH